MAGVVQGDYWALSNSAWGKWMEVKPILEKLHEQRVFSVGPSTSGNIMFMEECDKYFQTVLTSDELGLLILELTEIKTEMDSQNGHE